MKKPSRDTMRAFAQDLYLDERFTLAVGAELDFDVAILGNVKWETMVQESGRNMLAQLHLTLYGPSDGKFCTACGTRQPRLR